MQNFYYCVPTEVVFGKKSEEQVPQLVQKYGGSRVLLVYGGSSAKKSGLIDKIKQMLMESGIAYEEWGGVHPNPRLDFTAAGVKKALEFRADLLLAVGGGSVIDTAKAIALGAANPDCSLWDFWIHKAVPKTSLPVGAVLTIPAAGSETSNSSVLTNQDTMEKRGLSLELNRPRFAVLNPELTSTLPKFQIACGVVDIMMHTMDRYFTPTTGNELTDGIAEALLRVVITNGPEALRHPDRYQPMSELMWAGSLSHNGLTGLGAVKDFATHQLGHELSAMFDVTHGASLSAVWASWAHYVCGQNPGRFAQYAEKVWGITKRKDSDAAQAGIDRTERFFSSLDMPICLSDLSIGILSEDTLRELADRCVFRGTRKVGSFMELDREDVYRIYKTANH